MSAEATGWVWKHSPYQGAQLLVHLAIADVVNDVHENEFWMSTAALAAKAKVSRNTVTTTLSDMQVRGLLLMLESGKAERRPSRYRFLMGTSAVSALGTRDQRASTSAVSADPLARPARANPKEITEEPKPESLVVPDPDCIRCRGTGVLYRGSGHPDLGAFDAPCSCCDPRPVVEFEDWTSDYQEAEA